MGNFQALPCGAVPPGGIGLQNAGNLGVVPGPYVHPGLVPPPIAAKAPAAQARLVQQAQRAQQAAAKAAAKAAALAAQAGFGGPQIGLPGGAGAAVPQGAMGPGLMAPGGNAVAALNAAVLAGGAGQLFPGAQGAA